jgi:hypothetical protein
MRPMSQRPRIDLDGVTLTDVDNPYMPLAVFRHRTVEGLLLLLPESAEVLVRWTDIEDARLDLAKGELSLTLRADYVKGQNWLRGARRITGDWLDRFVMS